MRRQHLWGILVVLTISAFVLYRDLKTTPLSHLAVATDHIQLAWLIVTVLVMLGSYAAEAGIFATFLGTNAASWWGFFRIPLIQSLFNAITPLASGGQPAQLAALLQMGIEGGKASSVLLLKFILYQIGVFIAYVLTFCFGFRIVMAKFAGLAILILVGFIIHLGSIMFLLSIMFAYGLTQRVVKAILQWLTRWVGVKRAERWQQSIFAKMATFYAESQRLRQDKPKLIIASSLTVVQILCFVSVPYLTLVTLQQPVSWLPVTLMNIMLMMLIAVVPIPGASGGAELSFQTLFSSFLTGPGVLVLAMFMWRLVTYFLGIVLGIIGWALKPQNK